MTAAAKAVTPATLRKGWCPSLLTPMASGDGLLVRVKPRAARLSSGPARAIAAAAARYGNGHLDLTNRANLQVRGLRQETVAPFAATVLAQGLACADPAQEQIRNVMASPLGGDDPAAFFDSHAIAHALEEAVARERKLAALPAKFGFLVDGGGALPLDGVSADIAFRACGGEVLVLLDGADVAVICDVEAIAETARRLALAFLDLAQSCAERPRRMRHLVAALGVARIFAAAGLTPMRPAPKLSPARPLPIGFLSQPGVFGVGLPFGQITADALIALADLAERHGDGSLRLTPWRVLLLPGVMAASAQIVEADVRGLGLTADSHDPRLRIAACVGKPACSRASVDTRRAATQLAAVLPECGSAHISGCAKGCARPEAADVTLVGRDGRYDLVHHGRAGDDPASRGLKLEEVLAALRLPERTASS